MSKSTSPRSLLRRILAPAAALVVGGLLLATGAVAAQAAPPYATDGRIDTIKFQKESVSTGSWARVDATWSFPDNPTMPAGFTIDLPTELTGRNETFTITAQNDPNTVIANCVATPTQLQCDLDPAYVRKNPIGLKGDVFFWVRVDKEVTESTETTFTFNDVSATVTVTPPGRCTVNCELNWDNRKDGWYDYDNDQLVWYVHIAADRGGMHGGEQVVVTDTPGTNHVLNIEPGVSPKLMQTNQVGFDADGYERPQGWSDAPADAYTVDANGVVSFTAQQGYYYQVYYTTKPTAEVDRYTNSASIKVGDEDAVSVEREAVYSGGGGTGIGENVGVFSITKAVTGAPNLPSDLVFSGTYTVTPPTGDPVSGDWSLQDGETFRSAEFPRDSVVHLVETTPAQPDNITWNMAFSSNDFTLVGGELTEVTLTNTAAVKTGTFAAHKVLSGSDEAKALVPADLTFSVDYAYPAGVGFEAGSGSLDLPANGDVVTSPELPVGAVLTFTEVAPASIDGLTWGTATFQPATLTIGSDVVGELTLTNEVSTPPVTPTPTPTPTDTTTPTPTPTATQPPLAVTGGNVDLGGTLAMVGILIAAGASAVAFARTRRTVQD